MTKPAAVFLQIVGLLLLIAGATNINNPDAFLKMIFQFIFGGLFLIAGGSAIRKRIKHDD